MSKWWMPDNGTAAVGIHNEEGKWVSDAAYRVDADRLIDAHNADIDALEAERDELRRRLEAVVAHAAAPNWGDIVCAGGKLELATTRLDEIRAIAEGRDNG